MSEFEIFSVVLSFILGLGVAQILSSIVYVIHSRRDTTLRWTTFLWAWAIFLFHVNFLFAALWFYSADRSFTWYLVDLLSAVVLFLSGGLVLPPDSRPLPEDLRTFFDRDGKLALVPLGIFLGLSVPYNIQGGLPPLALDNLIALALLIFAAAAFGVRGRIRTVSTVAFAVLATFAFLFVYARPGVT